MATIATIIAIILGPILAIQVQKFIERITQRRDEKRRLFMTLMATRGRPLLPEHVQALNMIDIIFSIKGKIISIIFWCRSKKDKAVIDAWSVLRDHLYHFPQRPTSREVTDNSKGDTSTYNVQMQIWGSKKDDLLIELLDKMAISLGYYFDKALLKSGSYTPRHYGDLETLQITNLAGLADILVGNKPLPIYVVGASSTERTEPSQKASSETSEKQKGSPEIPKQDANQANASK